MKNKIFIFLILATLFFSCKTSHSLVNGSGITVSKEHDGVKYFSNSNIFSTIKFNIFSNAKRERIDTSGAIVINNIIIRPDTHYHLSVELKRGEYNIEIIAVGYEKKKVKLSIDKGFIYNINAYLDEDETPIY